jgi:hypothetical protein
MQRVDAAVDNGDSDATAGVLVQIHQKRPSRSLVWSDIRANLRLPEQPHDDQNQDEHEQQMNKIAGSRNPWNSCGPEVPQKPKNDEDDDEKFEHVVSFLRLQPARATLANLGPAVAASEFYSLLTTKYRKAPSASSRNCLVRTLKLPPLRKPARICKRLSPWLSKRIER